MEDERSIIPEEDDNALVIVKRTRTETSRAIATLVRYVPAHVSCCLAHTDALEFFFIYFKYLVFATVIAAFALAYFRSQLAISVFAFKKSALLDF